MNQFPSTQQKSNSRPTSSMTETSKRRRLVQPAISSMFRPTPEQSALVSIRKNNTKSLEI